VRTGGSFNIPAELAVAIVDAGYDGCSTASNHSYDARTDGVSHTLDILDAQGIGHAGSARSAEEAATPRIYDVHGIKVAHLSYTYGLNGFSLPAGSEYLVNLLDPERVVADAVAARAAGANVVVVSLHWGTEYEREPTGEQQEVAQRLSQAPEIDLVVGHHAHVVQPITRVGDLVVAYGLGNFLSNQSSSCCPSESQNGVIAQFQLTETGPASGEFTVSDISFTATRVLRETFEIVPVVSAMSDPVFDEGDRAVLDESRAHTEESINLLGPVAHPSGL
jgi:poly-gamma-glutamate synthesis protein (capsule biosynthesis protein)